MTNYEYSAIISFELYGRTNKSEEDAYMNTHKESSREKILDAAFKLLSAKGYANVSMRDIASEANVALSLLTYHFITKENLFTALAAKLVIYCFSDVEERLKEGKNESERMYLLSSYFEDCIRNNRDMMRIFLDFSTQALWNRSFSFQVTHLFEKLTELIKNEILSDNVRAHSAILGKYSPDVIAKVILGSLYGTAVQLLVSKKENKEETNEIFDLGNTLIDICSH